jgi:hypothetical protein
LVPPTPLEAKCHFADRGQPDLEMCFAVLAPVTLKVSVRPEVFQL